MNRNIFIAVFFFLSQFTGSCNEHTNNVSNRFSEDLFATTDTSLFHRLTRATNQSADTAFQRSTIVAVCKIISIDSSVHEAEKAPFYLVAASIDTVLKGKIILDKKLYFISYQTPAFNDKNANWIVYLSKTKNASLFDNSPIEWQLLDNAPYIKYTPAYISPNTVL